MTDLNEKELIYEWNSHEAPVQLHQKPVELDDETLRDGLQNPSVTDPPVEMKIKLLHLMAELGIDAADLGLPGAGPRARADITAMVNEIRANKLPIYPNAAVRTVVADCQALLDVIQDTGVEIEAAMFIGSSPIRQYAENWTLDHILKLTEDAVSFCTKNNIPVMYVTEDTTRARPEDIRKMYRTAIECGARRVCIADTVGYAMPYGVRNIVNFIRDVVAETGETVKTDWHGHNDRGLGVINALAAIKAGADRVHGCALGVGERVGNTSMDLMLVNLKLDGIIDRDLSKLGAYCQLVSEMCEVPLDHQYPVFGRDAFRTATGVHAAAIIKAEKKGAEWLADRVYSAVPAGLFGLHQTIEIGYMSGVSNIVYWLQRHGIEPEQHLVDEIFKAAKQHNRVLTNDEVMDIVRFVLYEQPPTTDTVSAWRKEIGG